VNERGLKQYPFAAGGSAPRSYATAAAGSRHPRRFVATSQHMRIAAAIGAMSLLLQKE
jgi:hypothetical protein